MRAIIPAAGEGKRLAPITDYIQKCLIPVGGKPILQHNIEQLFDLGASEIDLIVGSNSEQIIKFVEDTFPANNINFIFQEKRLGLGHAVFQALKDRKKEIVILLGDVLMEFDREEFSSCGNCIGTVPVEDPSKYGIVDIDDSNFVCSLVEKPLKPHSNLAIAGIYKISNELKLKEAIKFLIDRKLRTKNEYQLTDALSFMINNSVKFKTVKVENYLDCGNIKSLLLANNYLITKNGKNFISKSSKIKDSMLKSVTIMDNCIVESSSLKNVIVMSSSKLKNIKLENALIGFDEVVKYEKL
jgi:glucose-1-phosphate thymidylyltransferase